MEMLGVVRREVFLSGREEDGRRKTERKKKKRVSYTCYSAV